MSTEDNIEKIVASLWPDTLSQATGRYFCHKRMFALPRKNNQVQLIENGRDYFNSVAEALEKARKFILIADWQMGFDTELVKGVDLKAKEKKDNTNYGPHSYRLSSVLARAMKRGVHVRIMLYDSVDLSPASTFDNLVKSRLQELANQKYPGTIEVALQERTT